MEELRIVDHFEWWLVYEDRLHPEQHGIYTKYPNERQAEIGLDFARIHYPHRSFEIQKITVHRTAEKLDW